jgi:hypothetical protein
MSDSVWEIFGAELKDGVHLLSLHSVIRKTVTRTMVPEHGKLGSGNKINILKYSFVNRTIKHLNKLPAEPLKNFACR